MQKDEARAGESSRCVCVRGLICFPCRPRGTLLAPAFVAPGPFDSFNQTVCGNLLTSTAGPASICDVSSLGVDFPLPTGRRPNLFSWNSTRTRESGLVQGGIVTAEGSDGDGRALDGRSDGAIDSGASTETRRTAVLALAFRFSPPTIGAVFGVATQSERAGRGRNSRVSPLRRKHMKLGDLRVSCWRRGSESNRRIKVLQTLALPLGYRA